MELPVGAMIDRKSSVPVPTPHMKKKTGNGGSYTRTPGGLLKDQLELVKVVVEGRPRYSIRPIDEQLSFDKGFFVFIRAIQTLTARNQGVLVVGLAGPSGSGKTAFSQKVQDFMPGCAVLSLDNYNDASRLIDGNFDDPRLIDYELLLENLHDLKEGKDIQAPIYDFKVSKRVGYKPVKVPASRVVIVEGIYALSARIRPLMDLRVSVTGGVHFDLVKRVLRDIKRSGQPPEEIIQQITDTVYPMYKAYIEPDLNTAHLKIYNNFNPFSGFMAPTYILKSAKRVAPEQIRAVLKTNHMFKKDSDTYDIYLLPPGEDVETCTSWLRMRNRDGRYNLMFEEWVTDGPFIISPRITFEVSVRILGGLMALGYEIGTMLKRTSSVFSDEQLTIKLDDIEGMDKQYVQIQGKDRKQVAAAGKALGLEGTYIARSYIEQLQLEKLTAAFQCVTEDLRRQFMVDGEPLLHEDSIGSSPVLSSSFRRQIGFSAPERPPPTFSPAPIPPGRQGGARQLSSSLNSNGLLSQKIASSESNGHLPNGNGHGNGGGGSRQSSECSDEERPGSSSGSAKVEKLLARLSDRVSELTQVTAQGDNSALCAQLLELKEQQGAIVQQLYELSRSIVGHQQLQLQQAQQQQQLASTLGAAHSEWGAYSALGFVAAGAAAAIAILKFSLQ